MCRLDIEPPLEIGSGSILNGSSRIGSVYLGATCNAGIGIGLKISLGFGLIPSISLSIKSRSFSVSPKSTWLTATRGDGLCY